MESSISSTDDAALSLSVRSAASGGVYSWQAVSCHWISVPASLPHTVISVGLLTIKSFQTNLHNPNGLTESSSNFEICNASYFTMSVQGEKYYLYHYEPSKIAAIVFVVLFAITTTLHIYQLVRHRVWYFVPLVIGGLCKSIPDPP